MTAHFRDLDPTLTAPGRAAAGPPRPGEAWRLTTTCTVEDIGALPKGMVAFRVAGSRHYVFPLRAAQWRPAEVPTAEAVLDTRIHSWERAATNAARDSEEQRVARAVVDELVAIRSLITRGTFE